MQFVYILQVDSICLKEKKDKKSDYRYCLMAVMKENRNFVGLFEKVGNYTEL